MTGHCQNKPPARSCGLIVCNPLASLAELYILLRIYGGNPTFLMFGIEPTLCGVSELVRLNAQLTESGMIDCIKFVKDRER